MTYFTYFIKIFYFKISTAYTLQLQLTNSPKTNVFAKTNIQ